ncbi:unnamed protein product [Prorocentrum cordatum]|uniref:Casein kinase I n=1 Tax=Prorocentrum cordatum TaxID=2364126 RepID=A0ABN9YDZ7_9DINO|nr:unnamed protein product [Polarella glacialis]
MASSSSSKSKYPSSVGGGRYQTTKKLGAGCFGEVYRAVNASTKEQVAVKFEDLAADCPQLEQEAAMLESLRWPARQQGFAEYFHSGREGSAFCLVMEFLGKSLEDRVELCGGRLTPKTTALVAEQALQRIEYLHSKGIIHRDISRARARRLGIARTCASFPGRKPSRSLLDHLAEPIRVKPDCSLLE